MQNSWIHTSTIVINTTSSIKIKSKFDVHFANVRSENDQRQSLKQRRNEKVAREPLESLLRKRTAARQRQGEKGKATKDVGNNAESPRRIEFGIKVRRHPSHEGDGLVVAEADALVHWNGGLPGIQTDGVIVEKGAAHEAGQIQCQAGLVDGFDRLHQLNVARDKVAPAHARKAAKEGGRDKDGDEQEVAFAGQLLLFLVGEIVVIRHGCAVGYFGGCE